MNLESPILGQADPSFLKCTEQFTMADVQISAHPADIHSLQEAPMELYQPDIAIDTGAEVEVSTAARRGRGRPKKGFIKKEIPKPAEGTSKPKRAYKKRAPKVITETDVVPKAKRKYTPRRPKNAGLESADKKDVKELKEKKGKDKRKEGGRRKKEPVEKKPRERKPREKKPPREKKQKKKDVPIALPVTPIPIIHHSESSNDSVVFCSELAPSSALPPAPPGPISLPLAAGAARRQGGAPLGARGHGGLSPASSSSGGKGSQVISRLEDSSSSGGSGSSSSSDDEDGSSSSDDSSQSDRERQRYTPSPPPPPVIRSNGVSNHLSMSEGWSDHSSASDGEREGPRRGEGGEDLARLDSPPRSPSSASSECPDKPFQCHTCKKWFSTTVTLRIHKRSHVAKPSGGSGSGGGRASRRYECDCCEATFTRRERLEQHRSERHRGTLTERCEVCGRGFEDEEQQKRHFATHTPDERAGRCTECGEIYSSWEQLRRHRAAHAPPAPHACPLCRKAFTYSHSLSRHLSNHSKAVYKCVVCKTSFNDANSLASHLNSHLDRYRQLKTS